MVELISCQICAPYVREELITSPRDLRNIAARIEAAVASRQLVEVSMPEAPWEGGKHQKLDDITVGETLPDWLQHHFACTACGRRFELSCETYHGSGGWWRLRPES